MNAAGQNSLVGPSFHIYLRRTIRTITVSVVLSPERNIGSPPIPKSPRNPFNTRSLIIVDTYFESLKLFHIQQTASIKQSRLSAPFSRRRVTLNETDSDVREVLHNSRVSRTKLYFASRSSMSMHDLGGAGGSSKSLQNTFSVPMRSLLCSNA